PAGRMGVRETGTHRSPEARRERRTVTRAEFLTLMGGGTAALALPPAPAWADGYLEDPVTARAVSLTCPRSPLGACLAALGQAGGVPLAAAPELADEPLIGMVPTRPLRETMTAFSELFEGSWTRAAGGG